MKTAKLIFAAAIILSLIFVAVPVSARVGIKEIEPGNMIFVYEEGLDLTRLRDATIPGSCGGGAACTATSESICEATEAVAGVCHGILPGDEAACNAHATSGTCTGDVLCFWISPTMCTWTPPVLGADIVRLIKCSDTPSGGTCPEDHDISIPDDTDFDLYGSAAAGYYGIYYASDGGLLDTSKYVRIQQATTTLDVVLDASHYDSVNGDTITRDSEIAFKITSPNVGSSYRNGADTEHARIDLQVSTPSGATLTSFGELDLADIVVDDSEFYTAACDLSTVDAGEYTVQAKWSYPDEFISQAPDSNVVTFTVSSKSLTITSNKETVVKGSSFAITVIGESRKEYYLYVMSGSAPYPVFLGGQTDVTQMVAPTGITDEAGATGTFARIKTGAGGSITVELTTNNITDDESYDIKVRDIADSTKYDSVSVDVQKGEITLNMGGSGTFYMGDEISLMGTNTQSDYVYLFITGPNLNSNGVRIDNPDVSCIDGSKITFKEVSVDVDNEWKYKWDTSDLGLVLDAGSYTIYAASDSIGKNHLSSTTYETASITLKKAYLMIDLSSNSVASGDRFVISGKASGAPDRVYIWIFGKNYRNLYNSVSVDSDGTFEYEIDDTAGLYSGQYFVIVQHPMANGAGIYGVDSGMSTCSGTNCYGMMADADMWSFGPVRLSGLQASDAAQALKEAIDSVNIDDVYAYVTFTVDNAFITISSIPDKEIGDTITISGITNLATGDDIMIDVMSSSFKPTDKTQSSEFSAVSGMATVIRNNESVEAYNTFSFVFDTDNFKPDQYMVLAESIDTGTTATIMFNLREYVATPVPTPVITPIPTPATPLPTPIPTPLPTPPTTEPTPTPTKSPGFGVVIAVVGLCIVGYLVMRKEQ